LANLEIALTISVDLSITITAKQNIRKGEDQLKKKTKETNLPATLKKI
jgi:hypothetical protein